MAIAVVISFPIAGEAQQNSTQNSGDCTILVQGSNNNVTISAPCSPTKNPQLVNTTGVGSNGSSSLQFTVREFVIDTHSKTVYASIGITNHALEDAILQIAMNPSSLELSDPPASIKIIKVDGLGACNINSRLSTCIDRASEIDFTSISAHQTTSFRVSGHLRTRSDSIAASGTLNFVFLRKVRGKYEKLDVSFLDVKLSESR